jgi:class 3 adenylate cyclase
MAQLTAAERAALPDRAFAYVDGRGRRRLPIFDASHVRNALSRFNQVEFESDRARELARHRLLTAAKRFRIVPVGFIDAEIRRERGAAPGGADPIELPTGFVTLLMSDIEASTGLLAELGDDYGGVLDEVFAIQRGSVERHGGCVVEARADELFAVFASPRGAVEASLATHRELERSSWPSGRSVRVRIGVHAGYPTRRQGNYIGMVVHTTARICDAAHGGQMVVSDDAKAALAGMTPDGVRFRRLGACRLRGIPDEITLHQVLAEHLVSSFPPLRC